MAHLRQKLGFGLAGALGFLLGENYFLFRFFTL